MLPAQLRLGRRVTNERRQVRRIGRLFQEACRPERERPDAVRTRAMPSQKDDARVRLPTPNLR